MVLNDVLCSVLTDQIELNQRDLHSFPEFERSMDRRT